MLFTSYRHPSIIPAGNLRLLKLWVVRGINEPTDQGTGVIHRPRVHVLFMLWFTSDPKHNLEFYCIRVKWLIRPELIPVSVARSDYEYFYSPLDGMLVHRRVTPGWGEALSVREYNTMPPTGAGARNARSGDERTFPKPTAHMHQKNKLYQKMLWFVCAGKLFENRVSSELIRKSLACGSWFTNCTRVLPTSRGKTLWPGKSPQTGENEGSRPHDHPTNKREGRWGGQNMTTRVHRLNLRWLDRLKNEDIHQIYDFFENTIFKTLEHL